jgi:hypothetical protein
MTTDRKDKLIQTLLSWALIVALVIIGISTWKAIECAEEVEMQIEQSKAVAYIHDVQMRAYSRQAEIETGGQP